MSASARQNQAVRRIAATGRRIQAAGGATRTRERSRSAGKRAHATGHGILAHDLIKIAALAS